MTVFQELLILFGAPILVVVAVYAAIFLRHPRPQSRYRPGEPYDFKPVWFVARDGDIGPRSHPGAAAEIESGDSPDSSGEPIASGPKGGAHGQW
ncbi:aa3-type cytochrome oxidase subunit CtaJ [Glycomyces tarimensis]